jgi:hypothetical protein
LHANHVHRVRDHFAVDRGLNALRERLLDYVVLGMLSMTG